MNISAAAGRSVDATHDPESHDAEVAIRPAVVDPNPDHLV